MNIIWFIFISLIALWLGRRIDNRLVRWSLTATTISSIIVSSFWGLMVALMYRFLVCWTAPGLVLTCIGYLNAFYISMIYYGYSRRMPSTNLDGIHAHMIMVNSVSMSSYIIFSVVSYFTVNF
jgi:hypothetical protein